MSGFGRRVLGAALLRAQTYEEVEADPASIAQAALVVAGACAAIGVATFVGGRADGVAGTRLGLVCGLQLGIPRIEP